MIDNDHKSHVSVDNTKTVEDDLQRILKSAGIESARIDSLSLMALRKMITERRQDDNSNSNRSSNPPSWNNRNQPQQLDIGLYKTVHPNLFLSSSNRLQNMPSSSNPPAIPVLPQETPYNNEETSDSNANSNRKIMTTASSSTQAETKTTAPVITDEILSQLQYQTSVMLQLQQQIQALHYKVDYLERRQNRTQSNVNPLGITSPNSASSDGERSFQTMMASTKIYLRPSVSSEAVPEDEQEEYEQLSAMSSFSPQQIPSEQTFLQTGPRKFTTRRFVIAKRDNSNDDGSDNGTTRMGKQGDQTIATAADPVPAATAAATTVIGPQPQPQRPWMIKLLLLPFRAVIAYIRFEYQVVRVMWRMGRQQVRPMDGGVLMQLLFVLLVVAKTSAISTVKTDNLKQHLMLAMIALGFLYHMKVLTFLYYFFVKQNVPLRIWKGMDPEGTEDVYGFGHVAAAAAANPPVENAARADNGHDHALPRFPGPAGRPFNQGEVPAQDNPENAVLNADVPNQNINNNIIHRLEETFLMGGIAAPENPNENGRLARRQHPIVRIVWDIIYLFGSFFFSIFPMWKPEQRPRPVQREEAQEQQQQNGAINQAQANQRDDEHENHDHPIPHVAPPRDALQPADDESEEKEEDDDDDDDNQS